MTNPYRPPLSDLDSFKKPESPVSKLKLSVIVWSVASISFFVLSLLTVVSAKLLFKDVVTALWFYAAIFAAFMAVVSMNRRARS